MGLAHRIIPTFLVRGEMLVKGKQFAADRVVGHAVQAILVQAARDVDELVVLDVGATPEGRGPNLKLIERLSDKLFSPMAYGGGIRSLQDVRDVLRAGADKVVIGSGYDLPYLFTEIANTVGRQALVGALNVRRCEGPAKIERYMVKRHLILGTSDVTDAAALAAAMDYRGAGEILLQSVDRDGMLVGYDLELVRAVRSKVRIPVIASGGCGRYEHMHEALEAGASAVAAGAMFQWTDATPRGAALYLQEHGIEVRV